MIAKEYKQYKEQVLKIYDEYVSILKEHGKDADESIKKQAKKIRDEIFNLLVLGEAKSGKSTFINAYLGKEVMPMDVRQCTSAIIKIRKGDKFELIAKTAAKGKTKKEGYDNIREFLKEHAAISDKYRNIPITTINNELLIKYHGKIPKQVRASFLEGVKKDNIFNIDDKEYNELICQYVDENADNWGKIITEIEITYQLPDAMQGITIIDSPGVGAGGDVGIIAENYIANANAIIFVKALNGQALESSSFMKLLRENCTDRQKESLFLVFTGKSLQQGADFIRLKEQALELYKNYIDEEKIIFVDSKVQLFLNQCLELGTVEKIDEFFDEFEKEDNEFLPASTCWYKSKGDISLFKEKMENISDFSNVHMCLEKFARVANYVQLIDFLENLEKEYTRYKKTYTDLLKVAKDNFNDPDALENRISQKEKEIVEVYNKLNYGVGEINKKYTDNINGDGIIMAKADKLRSDFETKLEKYRNMPYCEITDSTFNEMKNMTMGMIDKAKDVRQNIAKEIIDECDHKLIEYTQDISKIPAEAFMPNFTETDFDEINADAEKKDIKYKDVEEGTTFLKTKKKVPYHDLKERVKNVADSIHNRLDDIISAMTTNVVNYVEECRKVYTTKLTEHKDELESEYESLLKDKNDNDKQQAKIQKYESLIQMLTNEYEIIVELKGELDNYVKYK
ncbi:MAG: dynamin family protein [Lachnospiraceae bacterium]|nr:dynamin family protein [Lachnospiraceae bacterium]